MKKFNLKKIGALTLISSISINSIIPTTIKANTTEIIQLNTELEKILKEENITNKEIKIFGDYVKQEIKKEDNERERSKLSMLKKTVEFLLRNTKIIPSKTIRDAFERYGSAIISAVDKIETVSRAGISYALQKAKVPSDVADLIADFLITYIL